MAVLRALSPVVVACLLVLSTVATPAARAASVLFGPHDVRSVFHVAKSENKNQVHYALHLDAQCKPMGKRPVFAYWQRLREGKRVDDQLTGLGTTVYGASDEQTIIARSQGATGVEMFVKALKAVRINIEVQKTPQGCRAVPYVTILKQRARLSHAFLQLGAWGLTVKYVDVVGFRVSDGKRIAERHE